MGLVWKSSQGSGETTGGATRLGKPNTPAESPGYELLCTLLFVNAGIAGCRSGCFPGCRSGSFSGCRSGSLSGCRSDSFSGGRSGIFVDAVLNDVLESFLDVLLDAVLDVLLDVVLDVLLSSFARSECLSACL